MYPHQIRLTGHWDVLTVYPPVRLQRRFGKPRQIDEWERVWLIAADTPWKDSAQWRVNGMALEWTQRGDGCWRADVTQLLRERNQIIVEYPTLIDWSQFGGAILEIGCRAFIQNVRIARQNVEIMVSSESADDPLELYVLVDGETHGYFGPFSTNGLLTHEFSLDEVEWKAGAIVRVDLICRSTIWDTVEIAVV